MSVYTRIGGSGSAGVYTTDDPFNLTQANRLRDGLDKLALAALQRNIWAGGTREAPIAVSADGDVDLLDPVPLVIDNTGGQWSSFSDANGAVLVAQFRFEVRVSDAAITVTPKLRYGATFTTITTVATISGAAACAATASDYSGTNQYQTVTVTLPSGVKLWKPQLTVAGTGGDPYSVWGRAFFDLYIQP